MSEICAPLPEENRRFAGVDRLYGQGTHVRLSQAHVAVVGLGGVGSWTVESLARMGVGHLTLVDFDVVAPSNVNRQIQATTDNFGKGKGLALRERIVQINPDCRVTWIDDFILPDNIANYFDSIALEGLIDATDQVHAKAAMVVWAKNNGVPIVTCGAAGGKKDPFLLRHADLSEVSHDRLLAKLRYQLRKSHGFAKVASKGASRKQQAASLFGVSAVFSAEHGYAAKDQETGGLQCAGYGSSVCVTASMGLMASYLIVQKITA